MAALLGQSAQWVEANITWEELLCWAEFLKLPDKQDIYLAQISAVIAQGLSGLGGGGKSFSIKDFLLFQDNGGNGQIEGCDFIDALAAVFNTGKKD